MSFPQMVVFGDSTSDAGRRFDAPASFDFDSIGPFPFTQLFDEPDRDVSGDDICIGDGRFLVDAEQTSNCMCGG